MLVTVRIGRTRLGILGFVLVGLFGIGVGAHAQPKKPAEPPWRRMLTGDDAQGVADLEKKLAALLRADQNAEAQEVARQIVEQRESVQGADHWQTADARRLLEELKRQAHLSDAERAQLREAAALHRRCLELRRAGKVQEALSLARESAALHRKLFGEEHVYTAVTYQALAKLLDAQAKYAEAETYHRRALAICRRVQGEEHPDTAGAYDAVATNLYTQGKYTEAGPLFQRCLALRCQVLGDEHRATVEARNNVAANLAAQDKYAEAEPLFRQALTFCRQRLGEAHPDTIRSIENLAFNLNAQGKYAEAEALHRTALALNRRRVGDEHADMAISYSNLALNLNAQGKYAEAEPLFRRALAISRKVSGEEHPDTARGCDNLALNLYDQGMFTEAEALARQSLAICRKVLGEEHRDTASSYNNVAMSLYGQGKFAEAEPILRQVLALDRKVRGEEHPHTAVSYNNLADDLEAQGKYAEAEPLYRTALALRRKLLGEEHPDTALSYHNLARILQRQGSYAAAEAQYRTALALRRRLLGEEHAATVQSYNNLAATLHAQGRYADAESMWQAAARGHEAARLRVSFTGLGRAVFGSQRSPLVALAACRARTGKPLAAWQAWEANLARGLLDDLSARLVRPLTDPERRREQEFSSQLQPLDKQLAALSLPGEQSDARRQQAKKLREQRDALLAELSRFEDELAKKYGPAAGQVYDLARIQAQLPPDAALLSWIDLPAQPQAADSNGEHWACTVRQRGDPVWIKLPGSGPKGVWTKDDDVLAAQVRGLFVEPPGDDAVKWREATGELYRQRLAPLAEHLGAGGDLPAVRRLIVLPSPALAGVPVEGLVEAQTDGQPAYTVSYAPSGTMFAWLQEKRKDAGGREKKGGPPRLLALGDPVFTRPGGAGKPFAPLPGTRREVEAIARLFERADRLLGSAASEQRLEALAASGGLADCAFLHLATHGVLHPQIAMHSALILAQDDLPDPLQQILAGKRAYDGRLTAEQILRSWKLDADLVTLSACQTGLGQYQGGEGYLGFAQALFLAGGRSLVLSLWKVDDNATALLMTRFYQNLLGKRKGLEKPMPKAEALQEAKAWLRALTAKEVDQRLAELPRGAEVERPSAPVAAVHPYAHPYYWAAFILIGDVR
jgi:CHAT domain-containing protein